MNASKLVMLSLILLSAPSAARPAATLPGLEAPVTIVRDSNGIPHIFAENEHDLFFAQGYVHAEDRLFQMDLIRRQADGSLAEVLGPAALELDVIARTIGLDRAAIRSLKAHSDEMKKVLRAYSDGVNAFIDAAEASGQLPPEYFALELTQVRRWQSLDSVLAGKALGAATSLIVADDIELTVALRTYQAVGEASRLFDGTRLFFEDLYRSAPFDPASTVPDALGFPPGDDDDDDESWRGHEVDEREWESIRKQGRAYLERLRKLRKFPGVFLHRDGDMGGSNAWVVSGRHTASGHPLLASDIHLRLESPVIFHQVHLRAPGIDVIGSSLPGAPCVIRGHNRHLAWGVTNSRLDNTDLYAETIVPDPESPSKLSTLHNSEMEWIIPIPIELKMNSLEGPAGEMPIYDNIVRAPLPPDFPPVVLIVPRRNNGPLITPPEFDPEIGALTAISVQSVGFGPTRDPEGVCALNRARNLKQFKAGLQLIDFASQNFIYADTRGNIAYFTSGELPLREDLENPPADRLINPPFLIRNGSGGDDWIRADGDLPDDQATPFKILPFNEMPQITNPPGGVIVNANNDHAGNSLDNDVLNDKRANGKSIYYLNWGGRNFSIRAGRITEMIRAHLAGDDDLSSSSDWGVIGHGADSHGSTDIRSVIRRVSMAAQHLAESRGKFTVRTMQTMQADTVLNDAKALVPFILEAYDNATRDGAHPFLAQFALDPGVTEAVGRLRVWNFTTPTGIPEGFDAEPDKVEAGASVAATIYAVWRGRMVANTIDAVLDSFGVPDIPKPGEREELVTALKHLLENAGVSNSGLNFFQVPGVNTEEVRRDIIVLTSLAGALKMLASDEFAPAFGNSVDQEDYHWGRLHRIVFKHPLGDVAPQFNVPPAFGFLPGPLEPDLAGIPVDGGFETVDVAPPLVVNNIRVTDSDSMMFEFAPTGRFVATLRPGWVRAQSSLPLGESANPFSPFYLNLLEPWLANETYRLLVSPRAILRRAASVQEFVP